MSNLNLISACLEIFGAVVMTAVLYSCLSDMNSDTKRDKYIVLMMEFAIVMLVTDAAVCFLVGNPALAVLMHGLSFISYVACEFEAVMFTFYMAAYIAEYVTIPKKMLVIALILGVVSALLWLVSIFTEWFYYVDDTGNFVYTDWYWVAVIPSAFIIVMNLEFVLRNAIKLPTRKLTLIIIYNFLPVIAVPFTPWFDTTPVYITVMLVLLLMYLMMHQDENLRSAEQSRELMKQRVELANSRTKIMMSQIQPHFLYNTLNAIYYLIEKDPKTAQKAVNDFSEYLRMNIDTLSTAAPVEFAKEMKHIETYLWIEKMRFDDELEIEYDINYTDFLVPALSVQPFVENAVKHGICKKDGGGTLKISTYRTAEGALIEIEDDGVGYDTTVTKKLDDGRSHVGVSNSRHRIETMMGGKIEVTSTVGVGTKVSIYIPGEADRSEYLPGKAIYADISSR